MSSEDESFCWAPAPGGRSSLPSSGPGLSPGHRNVPCWRLRPSHEDDQGRNFCSKAATARCLSYIHKRIVFLQAHHQEASSMVTLFPCLSQFPCTFFTLHPLSL